MEFTIKFVVLMLGILFTGLTAGLYFTWSNAITPGISRLDNVTFLKAIQQMNRTILNPLFFIVFFGPFFLSLFNFYVLRNSSSSLILLLIFAALIYVIGVILITIFGNVPLNEILDKTDLVSASSENLKALRDIFETKWNRLHLIRTISSIASFLLLIMSLIQIIKEN